MLWQQATGGTVPVEMEKVICDEREQGATDRMLQQALETFRDYAAQDDPEAFGEEGIEIKGSVREPRVNGIYKPHIVDGVQVKNMAEVYFMEKESLYMFWIPEFGGKYVISDVVKNVGEHDADGDGEVDHEWIAQEPDKASASGMNGPIHHETGQSGHWMTRDTENAKLAAGDWRVEKSIELIGWGCDPSLLKM